MGIAVAEVGHVSKTDIVPLFVVARMKAGPITRELGACGLKSGPSYLVIDRIFFLGIPTAVVVENHIGIDLHPVGMCESEPDPATRL